MPEMPAPMISTSEYSGVSRSAWPSMENLLWSRSVPPTIGRQSRSASTIWATDCTRMGVGW